MCILFKYVSEYLSAIASRRLTGTPYEKRCKISSKIEEDVQKIKETFKPLYSEFHNDNSISQVTDLLVAIANLLRLKSKDMIRLEISSLIRDYPGMPNEILFAIINARDDVTSNEAWELVNECMEAEKSKSNAILSRVYQMAKAERKTSQILMEMVPRFRRRVKISIAH
uniref:Exocyst complex component Sec6 n=1 Tax=Syphacia muris TaxID=451379 RepID=A0A0N5ANX9_9BILA